MVGKVSGLQGGEDGLGVLVNDGEQSLGGSFRFAASLFPVLKRGFADADHQCEMTL